VTSLDRMSWPEVDRADVPLRLVVPVGSCEQHGPHLPLDVDTTVAIAVVAGLADATADVVAGPPLAYGASGEHEGFAGTLSIGTEALRAVLVELGRSASRWAGSVLFVTGHGGNARALVDATRQLRQEGRDAAWWPCAVPGADAHAGRTETSLSLALTPSRVRLDRAEAGCREPVSELLPQLRAAGVAAVSANGVLGDPAGASAAEGRELLAGLVERLRRDIAAWEVRASDGRLAPAPALVRA
jgi:mycofactocin system creatininase family protein